MYAPYDQSTYQSVLELLGPEDVVLDIGAGDLRFSRQAALTVEKVYAVEINAQVLDQACTRFEPMPDRLIAICADARVLDFPTDITVGVLLMRHCTHFRFYSEKLRKAGAKRLITNARWRMSTEEVDLQVERVSYREVDMGWYACLCGGAGFKVGPAEQWSIEKDKLVHEVADCPQCNQV